MVAKQATKGAAIQDNVGCVAQDACWATEVNVASNAHHLPFSIQHFEELQENRDSGKRSTKLNTGQRGGLYRLQHNNANGSVGVIAADQNRGL